MRIFISLAIIITLLFIKVRANDDMYATELIDQWAIEFLQFLKVFYTPANLFDDIPSSGRIQKLFQRLSENIVEACKTFEYAQFCVSAVQPSAIVERFNTTIAEFDQTYQEHANRQIMKQNVIATRNQLSEYGNEIAPFTVAPFSWFNGTKFIEWTQQHRNDFQNVRIVKKLTEYLKHINNNLIASIQKSIRKSRSKIEHRQLKRLGTKILRGVEKFQRSVDEVVDVSNSLEEIRNAIDRLRNTNNGKYFNDMKTNARKILTDLNQLQTLMEIQWIHMDYICRTRDLPQQLPVVNLAN